jgi:hypothetical protein
MITRNSPYHAALGARFESLAPVLKRHCDLREGQTARIEGRMDAWNRYPFLRLFIPFMPIAAKDIRVVVEHRGLIDRGELCYESMRAFHNPGGIAYSYTLTRPLSGTASPCVFDTFNQPPNIGVTLGLEINDSGREFRQFTVGPQFALFGERRLRLPGFANIRSVATERAIDDETIHTDVVIEHPLLGRMFGYAGTLKLIS